MASEDSATRRSAAAGAVKGDDGLHRDEISFWQQFTKEQRAALIEAAMNPSGDPDSLLNSYRSLAVATRSAVLPKVKGLDDYLSEWRALKPSEKNKATQRLVLLRREVQDLPPFENLSLELDRQDPEFLVRAMCRQESDYSGFEVPIELYALERLLSAEAQAWEQAAHYVNLALADERLRSHPAVKEMFEKMAITIDNHTLDDLVTPENVLRSVLDPVAVKEAGVKNAQLAARSKNLGAKEWTRSVWRFVRSLDAERQGMVIAVRGELQRMFSQRESYYTQAEMLDFAEGLEKTRAQQEEPKSTIGRMLFSEYVNGWLKKNGFRDFDEKTNETKTKPVKVKALQIYRVWLDGL